MVPKNGKVLKGLVHFATILLPQGIVSIYIYIYIYLDSGVVEMEHYISDLNVFCETQGEQGRFK